MSQQLFQVLITGANGQLGRSLAKSEPAFGIEAFYADKEDLDITDAKALDAFIRDHKIRVCINCAAFTAVDTAESKQTMAHEINAYGAGLLASICANYNIPIIQLSTDYVYREGIQRPLVEEDEVKPLSVYGQTKALGEHLVSDANRQSIIVRTSWLYSEFGNNFVKTMLSLAKKNQPIRVVNDQVGSPTYATDLARAIWAIVHAIRLEKAEFGVFNYANHGAVSWYDFAREIFELENADVDLRPTTTGEYDAPAPRPAYSVLDTSRITESFGVRIRNWDDALKDCLKELRLAINQEN